MDLAELSSRGGTGSSDDEDEKTDDSIVFANSDSNEDILYANESSNLSCDNSRDHIEEFRVNEILPTIYYSTNPVQKTDGYGSSNTSTPCSYKCKGRCMVKVEAMIAEDREKIKNQYVGQNSVETKNRLLLQLSFQKSAGLPTTGFFHIDHLLCVNSFSEITSISSYILRNVLKDFSKGTRQYFQKNKAKKISSTAVVNFCAWMKVYSSTFGQDGPTDVVTVLPSFFNKAELFKIYKKDCPAPHIKISTMYKIMRIKFGPRREDKSLPWIRISKFSTHSKCDVCIALDKFMRQAKSSAEIEYGRGLKLQHSDTYSRARIAVNEYIQRSIIFPDEVLAFQIDSMDNSKSMIPRLLERSKQLSGMYKLDSKITGCITHSSCFPGQRMVKFYINHGRC